MKPKTSPQNLPDQDLFLSQLDNIINKNHELVKLSSLINWDAIEEDLSSYFIHSKVGNVALPTRLVAGVMYLQHTYDLSDELVCMRWSENPYWQYFCGETYFQHRFPFNPSSFTRWRKRLGKEGCEKLMIHCLGAIKHAGYLKDSEVKSVIVDTTVQEKAITFPTDSKLLNKARQYLVDLSKQHGIVLRQNYNRVASDLVCQISRYPHAQQYKRMRSALTKLKKRVGRVYRDVNRQIAHLPEHIAQLFAERLDQTFRLLHQTKGSKNKLYSLHEPQTECISKGKVHKHYEFGVKASYAVSYKNNWIIGAMSCPGNPYDGHTLENQIQQVMRLTGIQPKECFVDKGYRGVKITGTDIHIPGKKRASKSLKNKIKRRSAIEPVIGHMKSDGKLKRNHLRGAMGDAINTILCGIGFNFRKLLALLRLFYAYFLLEIFSFSKIKQQTEKILFAV